MFTFRFKLTAMIMCVCCLLAMHPTTTVCADQETVSVQSSASSALLYEPLSGRVLYEKQAHIKRPVASTTKLMTALLAVEMLASDAVLTVCEDAVRVEGSSMGLVAGDTVSRNDLLYGLLLASGNDAANVFALSIAASYEEFAHLMNARASSLGMTNTQFVTPSGLDAQGHGSSAYDMALLAAAVLQNETLSMICAAKSATVHIGTRTVTVQNHNKLLSLYKDCIGMKTGYTSLAGRCLVSAAKRDGVTLIAVTLDCANDWQEHQTLYDEGFALTERVILSPPDLSDIPVFGGSAESCKLFSPQEAVTLLKGDADFVQTSVSIKRYVWAPLAKGQTVGHVDYTLRGALLKSVPIKATHTVGVKDRESVATRTRRLFLLLLREALT